MSTAELQYIKAKQREFEQIFGRPLHVNFPKMNGLREFKERASEEYIREALEKRLNQYGADLHEVRCKRIGKLMNSRERDFMIAFTKDVIDNNWNFMDAARLLNKDRTIFYYYQNLI